MIALAQGMAGIALVMSFALLRIGQIGGAAILLAVQSGAVAVAACALHQPLMAVPPLILTAGIWWGGVWLIGQQAAMHESTTPGGGKLSIGAGAVLAILCQSQGNFALPLAIVLLSLLLAASRPHKLMQVIALVSAQNGVALAGGFVSPPAAFPGALLLAAAYLMVPVPLAACLLVPFVPSAPWPRARAASPAGMFSAAVTNKILGGRAGAEVRKKRIRPSSVAGWLEWTDLALALAMFAATLIISVDSLAVLFAPLIGLDGVLRSFVRRGRRVLTVPRRAVALAQTGFAILAVCAPNLSAAWLAVVAAMAMALVPAVFRRWDSAVLAFLAAALALFGIILLTSSASILGYFSVFLGFVTIAAVVPELAVVLVILLLRFAIQTPWPTGAGMLGIGIASVGLLACALFLADAARPHRTTLLTLSQASIAALAICTGQADGRFAALVLLILLILSRAATRVSSGGAAALATAGLAGVPPLGVFPGLVLVALTLSAHNPWLLLVPGVVLIPVVLSSLPRRIADFPDWKTASAVAWLPLLLTILAGYFAPEGLVQSFRILAAGHS